MKLCIVIDISGLSSYLEVSVGKLWFWDWPYIQIPKISGDMKKTVAIERNSYL